jgi:hypothetical protein
MFTGRSKQAAQGFGTRADFASAVSQVSVYRKVCGGLRVSNGPMDFISA